MGWREFGLIIIAAFSSAALITLLQNGLQDLLPHFAENGQQLEVIVFAIIYVLALQFARGGVMPFMLRYLPKPARQAPAAAEPRPRGSARGGRSGNRGRCPRGTLH